MRRSSRSALLPVFARSHNRHSVARNQKEEKETRSRAKRRELVLGSVGLFSLIGSDDPVTVLNGVLSGYGLPTLKEGSKIIRGHGHYRKILLLKEPSRRTIALKMISHFSTQRVG